MPINLQGSGNIAEGWGAPPKLDAPNIGGVLGEILQQRRYQEALTQKNIAGAIKQMQEQRQNQAYLEAMQKAGILPEGDYGALGAEGASDLAKQILAKKVADARMEHLLTTGGRGRGGGGGGGGSEATQVEAPEDYYGLHNAPGIPTTKTINGIVHVRTPKGGWKPGPKWMQAPGGETPKLSPTEKGWAAPEIPGLSVNINAPDEDTQSLAPAIPPMPTGGSSTAPPSDTAAGHAQDYGTKAVYMKAPDGTVLPVDSNLVEYYKSKGAVVVPGP